METRRDSDERAQYFIITINMGFNFLNQSDKTNFIDDKIYRLPRELCAHTSRYFVHMFYIACKSGE